MENADGINLDERGRQGYGEGHGHGHDRGHQHGRDDFGHGKSDDLYSLMRGCGHYLHHSSEKHQKAEGENQLFAVLDDEEQKCLKGLLKKLLDSWA
ncbi:hypothetical protein [Parablautia muri]|uniref:Uncharacterized protein n=1 Tax=Parablautia muri TaxID=2320879 RepID=A0A9X5GT77_9FIRM|nr:hypothetical protein [Parablautia muri]NBJ93909.1 hypothetical protein [Parablautia muri]